MEKLPFIITFEKISPSQKPEHQGATTEKVTLGIVALFSENFRGNIARSPAFFVKFGVFISLRQVSSKTEISDFDIELLLLYSIYQNII